jgi:hypothetical protein
MKNIHVIPTTNPSKLYLSDYGKELNLSALSRNYTTGQHIYITSDEKIKEGDWCLGMDGNFQYKGKVNIPDIELPKKIILTTDQD